MEYIVNFMQANAWANWVMASAIFSTISWFVVVHIRMKDLEEIRKNAALYAELPARLERTSLIVEQNSKDIAVMRNDRKHLEHMIEQNSKAIDRLEKIVEQNSKAIDRLEKIVEQNSKILPSSAR